MRSGIPSAFAREHNLSADDAAYLFAVDRGQKRRAIAGSVGPTAVTTLRVPGR
jgi:hypothetical protein